MPAVIKLKSEARMLFLNLVPILFPHQKTFKVVYFDWSVLRRNNEKHSGRWCIFNWQFVSVVKVNFMIMIMIIIFYISAGLNDLPPMDVSGESFRLDSRARNADSSHKDNQDKQSAATAPPAAGSTQGQAKLFGALDLTASM